MFPWNLHYFSHRLPVELRLFSLGKPYTPFALLMLRPAHGCGFLPARTDASSRTAQYSEPNDC